MNDDPEVDVDDVDQAPDADPLPDAADVDAPNMTNPYVDEPVAPVRSVKEAYASSEYADLIREIGEGKWGSGQERRRKLHEAGYDFRAVQREIVRLSNL